MEERLRVTRTQRDILNRSKPVVDDATTSPQKTEQAHSSDASHEVNSSVEKEEEWIFSLSDDESSVDPVVVLTNDQLSVEMDERLLATNDSFAQCARGHITTDTDSCNMSWSKPDWADAEMTDRQSLLQTTFIDNGLAHSDAKSEAAEMSDGSLLNASSLGTISPRSSASIESIDFPPDCVVSLESDRASAGVLSRRSISSHARDIRWNDCSGKVKEGFDVCADKDLDLKERPVQRALQCLRAKSLHGVAAGVLLFALVNVVVPSFIHLASLYPVAHSKPPTNGKEQLSTWYPPVSEQVGFRAHSYVSVPEDSGSNKLGFRAHSYVSKDSDFAHSYVSKDSDLQGFRAHSYGSKDSDSNKSQAVVVRFHAHMSALRTPAPTSAQPSFPTLKIPGSEATLPPSMRSRVAPAMTSRPRTKPPTLNSLGATNPLQGPTVATFSPSTAPSPPTPFLRPTLVR